VNKGTIWLVGLALAALALSACAPRELSDYDQWDLVFISDSSGWGVANAYAQFIEEDTGIPVVVHDLAIGGLSAGRVLIALRGESRHARLSELPELLREAEVVVLEANPMDSISEDHPGDWNCVDFGWLYVNACGSETFDAYRADLETIYDAIFALRGNKPVIVRARDLYNFPTRWEEEGVGEACATCWANFLQAIYEVAAEYNVPVARVFDTYNGPNHDEDPEAKGLTLRHDVHPSPEGVTAQAQILRELGYEPTTPSR